MPVQGATSSASWVRSLPGPHAWRATAKTKMKPVRMARGYTHGPGEPRSISYMRLLAIPCLADNFAYLVIDGGYAAVVDPGEAGPVAAATQRERMTLKAIWLTHHHWDRVGGVEALVAAQPGLEVVAHVSDRSRVTNGTRWVDEGDTVELGGVRARILHNPGHTLGAISY